MEPRYILAGHSHAFALGLPNSPQATAPSLEPIVGIGHKVMGLIGGSPRPSQYWDVLVANAENATVLLSWNGNQHLAKFLFETGSPFDFFLAEDAKAAIGLGVTIVPETLVREALGAYNASLKALLVRLNGVSGCKTMVVGTPPPKGNDQRLRALLNKEQHFVNAARQLGVSLNEVKLTKPLIRRKLWLIVQDLLREAADDAACSFIPAPARAMDADGFLKEELWREDVTHANTSYGDLFWHDSFPPESNVV